MVAHEVHEMAQRAETAEVEEPAQLFPELPSPRKSDDLEQRLFAGVGRVAGRAVAI